MIKHMKKYLKPILKPIIEKIRDKRATHYIKKSFQKKYSSGCESGIYCV